MTKIVHCKTFFLLSLKQRSFRTCYVRFSYHSGQGNRLELGTRRYKEDC
jgi:hypothetical protein